MENNIRDIGHNLDNFAVKVVSPLKGTATILKSI